MSDKVKCSKCGFIGDSTEFPKGRDFFQNAYVAGCPKCDNRQNPADASIRGMGGERPFVYVREPEPGDHDIVGQVLHRMQEAS